MSDQPFQQRDPSQSTRDVAVEETKTVGHDAKEGAKHVAQTAGAEAQAVVGEAKAQVSSLYESLRHDVTGQARDQTQRAATGLHGLAGELSQMAHGSSQPGMASGLVRQVAGQVDAAAGWLDGREPADVLEEVRRYARRNPGTFLAACAVVGFVGGRLTRGLRDDAKDQGAPGPVRADRQALMPGTTGVPAPQPLMTDPGYGGRPGAGPEIVGAGAVGGLGTAAGVGTAAGDPLAGTGHPVSAGPGRTEGELDREAGGTDPVLGDQDLYRSEDELTSDDPFADDLTSRDPFADAPDLGQGQGGDRR